MKPLIISSQTLSFQPSSVPSARLTEALAFPISDGPVIKYLKDCGVDVTPVELYATFLKRPSLWLGFTNYAEVSQSHKGYLGIRYFHSSVGRVGPPPDAKELLKHHTVMFRLHMSHLAEDGVNNLKWKPSITSHIFKMKATTTGLVSVSDACVDFKSTADPDNLLGWTDPSSKWKIVVSLSLIVIRRPDFVCYGRFAVLPTQDQDCFTLVANNGVELKCNRSVLATKSPYFHRFFQFQSAMVSLRNMHLEKMSEMSVQAFLDYLYNWKTSQAQENPLVCVDLLEAAIMFEIAPMELCMEVILLSKPMDWYSPEAALRLMLYVKDTQKKKLKAKAIELFELMFAEIELLPEYNKLFSNSSQRLLKCLFTA